MKTTPDVLEEKRGGDHHGTMVVRHIRHLAGQIRVPGDKSVSHRSVILGGMASGKTCITGFLPSDDCLRTLSAFSRLGVQVWQPDPASVQMDSPGFDCLQEPDDILDFGNSGTAARLMCGVLAGTSFFSIMTGDDSLRKRPMGRVVIPLSSMGAMIDGPRSGSLLPLSIRGKPLKGITFFNAHKSAQVKSSILLAGLNASGPTTVEEPLQTRDHTERLVPLFGGTVVREGLKTTVYPGKLNGTRIEVPGDFSSAAFFIALALMTPSGSLTIERVGLNPTRTALLKILASMGANSIRIEPSLSPLSSAEPSGTVHVSFSELKGIDVPPEWIPNAIDEIPALAACAACAEGTTVIRGAAELRVKESDRILGIARALSSLGISCEEFPDGLAIHGKGPSPALKGGTIDSFSDHRIAMAMATLGTRLPQGESLTIRGTDFVSTSFPGFSEIFNQVTSC